VKIHLQSKSIFFFYSIQFYFFYSFRIDVDTIARPINKKSLTEPVIRRLERSHSNEESTKKKLSKRKHSISPLPSTPITIKKRTKHDSSIKKSHSKRKEAEQEEEHAFN